MTPENDTDDVIPSILKQAKSGNVSGAFELCEQSLKDQPERSEFYSLASKLLHSLNEPERSLDMMEIAAQKADASSGVLLELAQMYVDRNLIKEAKTTCQTYIKKFPNSPLGYNTLAQILENQNDFSGAVDLLRKAVDVVSGDEGSEPAHLNTLGATLRRTGEAGEAIDVLQRAIDIDSQRPELHFNIANAYMDFGDPDKAIDHYRLTLDINPQHPDTHLHLGFAYLIKGNFKRGWREMEWRWKIPVFQATALDSPRWNGKQTEGTVLLLAEQGFGDSVHFIRYANKWLNAVHE